MSTLFRAETGHAAESRRHSIKAVCCVIGLVVCALSIGVRAEQAVTLSMDRRRAACIRSSIATSFA